MYKRRNQELDASSSEDGEQQRGKRSRRVEDESSEDGESNQEENSDETEEDEENDKSGEEEEEEVEELNLQHAFKMLVKLSSQLDTSIEELEELTEVEDKFTDSSLKLDDDENPHEFLMKTCNQLMEYISRIKAVNAELGE